MSVKAIKIMQKKLGLPDADYRALLMSEAGVTSSTQLDPDGDKKVMNALNRLINERNHARHSRPKSKAESKIWAIWYQELCPHLEPRCRNVRYLAGIISNRIGRSLRAASGSPVRLFVLPVRQVCRPLRCSMSSAMTFRRTPNSQESRFN